MIDLRKFNNTQGFKIIGSSSGDIAGGSVSSAGDINADGIPDLMIGAPRASFGNLTEAGIVYVIYGKKEPFSNIDLSKFENTQGFKILGSGDQDLTGVSVSNIGDFNVDGIDDVLIGALYASPLNREVAGISYVIYGNPGGYNDINLATLTQNQGFKILGATTKDASGSVVSGLGDINADGIKDIAIGSDNASPMNRYRAGESYIIYGKKGGYDLVDLKNLDETQGFRIIGAQGGDNPIPGDLTGIVSGVGDFNLDGINDIAVGAFNADPLNRGTQGAVYVVWGRKGMRPDIDLSMFNHSQGFRMIASTNGGVSGERFGGAIADAGDVNADGIHDIVIGAYEGAALGRFQAGTTYVVYGKKGVYAGDLDMDHFNSSYGFRLFGEDNSCSGSDVKGVGDINRDGIDDIMTGAVCASPLNRESAGAAYLVYGKKGGYAQDIDLSVLSNTDGVQIYGAYAQDSVSPVSGIFDVNADGINDILLGAPSASPSLRAQAGEAYVIYGGNFLDYEV